MNSSDASDGYPKKPGASAPPTLQQQPVDGIRVQPMNQSKANYGATNKPLPPAGLDAGPMDNNNVPWFSGLFSCFDDIPTCCLSCWCPCITFGRIAEIADYGSVSCSVNGALYTLIALLTGCACCYSCFFRTKIRHQYQLQEDPCNDCLVHFCCECCALTQEYRKLKTHGFDMSIGWYGNMERQKRGIPMALGMAPVPLGAMLR
ncbi:hypothetical protein BT93_L1020 [Corymbia citriodora subsp. variegata]|uniref:Uncharacterized protein n=1 Tax=Corymbia citriodora subsp. variegata TaxID=360336 RepID=A0A8T0CNS1_CORYI|nr:hypothetical protein BT93_L1020 [Corymbia citriodora subsp. variegata]